MTTLRTPIYVDFVLSDNRTDRAIYNKVLQRANEHGIIRDNDLFARPAECFATDTEWTLDKIKLWQLFEKETKERPYKVPLSNPFFYAIPAECRREPPDSPEYLEAKHEFFSATLKDLCCELAVNRVGKIHFSSDHMPCTMIYNTPLIIVHKETVTEACIIPTLIPELKFQQGMIDSPEVCTIIHTGEKDSSTYLQISGPPLF